MADIREGDSPLSQLQSKSQTELLDAVDQLRLNGFKGGLNDVPELVVVGDQSSGKSSVLDAISGVRFPTYEEVCTRFATEVRLRRSDHLNFTAWIKPAGGRTTQDMKKLESFKQAGDLKSIEEIPLAINDASKLMQTVAQTSSFYDDKLVVEMTGPNLPLLTLVDLPGLIQFSNQNGEIDVEAVRRLIYSHVSNPKSIILAIVAADDNFENQMVLDLIEKVDKTGSRTLGIITKPDRVQGSEKSALAYAQNIKLRLKYGWHILRNRGPKQSDFTAQQRDDTETDFFANSAWSVLPENHRGAASLKIRLSDILLRSICTNLSSLVRDIKVQVTECEKRAARLGQPIVGERAQRLCLTLISSDLHVLVSDAIKGDYRRSFFQQATPTSQVHRRLRAQLRDEMEWFAQHMGSSGQRYILSSPSHPRTAVKIDFSIAPEDESDMSCSDFVDMSDLLGAISNHMKKNRGCEPEGLFAPSVIHDLFVKQSVRWKPIAEWVLEHAFTVVEQFFRQVILDIAPSHIAESVLHHVAEDHFETCREDIYKKLDELLRPFRTGHLILLNTKVWHSKKAEYEKLRLDVKKSTVGTDADEVGEAFDKAWAHYDMALEMFTQNFSTLAIENCLVESLSKLFRPADVAVMSAELVQALCAEPSEIIEERESNQKSLETLKEIQAICIKHKNALGNTYAPAISKVEVTAPDHSEAEPEPMSSTEPTRVKEQPPNNNTFLRPVLSVPTPPQTPPNLDEQRTGQYQNRSNSVSPARQPARREQGIRSSFSPRRISPMDLYLQREAANKSETDEEL